MVAASAVSEATGIPTETIALLYATPREEALASGALVAASEKLVREAGYRWPILLTRAAWDRHVALSDVSRAALCDETGRLWDVLWMMRVAALRADADETGPMAFDLLVVTDRPMPHRARLYAFLCGGDEERSIVIATPSEALGETKGKAMDTFLRMEKAFDDTDEDDDG